MRAKKSQEARRAGIVAAVMAMTLFAAVGYSAEPERLLWVVQAGEDVDKTHGEMIYLAACHWIEDQVDDNEPACPKLTVHVGESCPHTGITGSCMNPALGQLYLPKWDDDSPRAVVQATLATALYSLTSGKEEKRKSGMLLARNLSRPLSPPAR